MIIPVGDVYNRPGSARIATWSILILNIAVYLFELAVWKSGGEAGLDQFFLHYGAVPAVVTLPPWEKTVHAASVTLHVSSPHWLGLFTSLFVHANIFHLAGNMLFFWIFADNVEDMLGTAWFVILYFVCGIMANVAQISINPHSLIPTIGASGAIAGILGAYLLFFPWNRVKLFYWFFFFWFGIWEVPALAVLGLWFVWQLFSQLLLSVAIPSGGGGVAYMAHVGGFLCGALLAAVFPKREEVRDYYRWIFQGRQGR